jgi:ParB family transcriptional regulator, chromosome partitioning protein
VTNERRGGLGRGLSALIPNAEENESGYRRIPLELIDPNPRQPRELFDETELAELAASIREVGLLQPIVVRAVDGRFELVAGERRVRASRIAGLDRVPAIVRETSDDELLREALIENIHRAQLNPLEEAAAYRQLLEDLDVTHEELADRVGKSRPAVSNALRLLALPPKLQRRVAAGVLSAGHAKALLALDVPEDQEELAERITAEGLSVRATEELVRLRREGGAAGRTDGTATRGRRTNRDGHTKRGAVPGLLDLQQRLTEAIHAEVEITMGKRSGTLAITFVGAEDLERIVGVIADGLRTAIPVAEEPLG